MYSVDIRSCLTVYTKTFECIIILMKIVIADVLKMLRGDLNDDCDIKSLTLFLSYTHIFNFSSVIFVQLNVTILTYTLKYILCCTLFAESSQQTA